MAIHYKQPKGFLRSSNGPLGSKNKSFVGFATPLFESPPPIFLQQLFLCMLLSFVIACSDWGSHVGPFQHDRADRFVGLRPGIMVLWSPVVSEQAGEGFQKDSSDDRIVLWPDAICDVPMAQAFECTRQHLWLPEVLDHQDERS